MTKRCDFSATKFLRQEWPMRERLKSASPRAIRMRRRKNRTLPGRPPRKHADAYSSENGRAPPPAYDRNLALFDSPTVRMTLSPSNLYKTNPARLNYLRQRTQGAHVRGESVNYQSTITKQGDVDSEYRP